MTPSALLSQKHPNDCSFQNISTTCFRLSILFGRYLTKGWRSGNFSYSIPICFYQIRLKKKKLLHFVTPPPTHRRHNFASHFFEFFLSAWPSTDTFRPFFVFIFSYLSAYYFARILDAILRFIKHEIFRYIPRSFYYFKILGVLSYLKIQPNLVTSYRYLQGAIRNFVSKRQRFMIHFLCQYIRKLLPRDRSTAGQKCLLFIAHLCMLCSNEK